MNNYGWFFVDFCCCLSIYCCVYCLIFSLLRYFSFFPFFKFCYLLLRFFLIFYSLFHISKSRARTYSGEKMLLEEKSERKLRTLSSVSRCFPLSWVKLPTREPAWFDLNTCICWHEFVGMFSRLKTWGLVIIITFGDSD